MTYFLIGIYILWIIEFIMLYMTYNRIINYINVFIQNIKLLNDVRHYFKCASFTWFIVPFITIPCWITNSIDECLMFISAIWILILLVFACTQYINNIINKFKI